MIDFDDEIGEENQTKFKTRGRHTVAKVLMQACRVFGLEDYYDKCVLPALRLVLWERLMAR